MLTSKLNLMGLGEGADMKFSGERGREGGRTVRRSSRKGRPEPKTSQSEQPGASASGTGGGIPLIHCEREEGWLLVLPRVRDVLRPAQKDGKDMGWLWGNPPPRVS